MSKPSYSENDLKSIRKFIFDTFVETSHAPVVEQLIRKFNMPRSKVEKILHSLEDQQSLVLQPSSNKILMLHPFSNIPTCWVVKPNLNTTYYANCAWDSIAMHFSLHKDVNIESFCVFCNNDINIRLENGTFKEKNPQTTIIAITKPASKWWNDIVDTCGNNMNYFCSEEHLKEWELENNMNHDQVGIFTDYAVTELSRLVYSTKDQFDYKHQTDDEEQKIFRDLNLVGYCWDFTNPK